MPTFNVSFYDTDPITILSQTIGGTATWTGAATAAGSAAITDTETGLEGDTLDENVAGGETATADITLGATTSTGVPVYAAEVWTLRDTVTGEVFELATLRVNAGALTGFYTLSEQPLVAGRLYETLAFDNTPDVTAGDPAFEYSEYLLNTEHVVQGTAGADTIDASYTGDPQGHQIDDGAAGGAGGNDNIVYAEGGADSVDAGAGADTVFGGDGNDTILGGLGDDSLLGEAGDDSILFGAGDDTVIGGAGADFIDDLVGGTETGANSLDGGAGNDTIFGGGGNDTILGRDDDDQLFGEDGDDSIDAGAGADTVDGGAGDDSISGGAGNDVLTDSGAATQVTTREALQWDLQGPDNTVVEGGFTQTTGQNAVTFSLVSDVSSNHRVETGSAITTSGIVTDGSAADTNSSMEFRTNNTADSSEVQLDFATAAENLSFRLADVDELSELVITALDADGNPVAISFTDVGSALTVDAGTGTVTANSAAALGSTNVNGAVTVSIAGPVSILRISHDNNGGGGVNPQISDIYFDTTTGETSSDTIDGGGGNDSIDAGDGDDSLTGGTGADTVAGGAGDDTIQGDLTSTAQTLDWSAEGADGTDLAAGFTQNTGLVDVSVSFTDTGNNAPTFAVETSDAIFTAPGESFDTNSSLFLFGTGDAATSTTTIDFASALGSEISGSVENVAFRISDIDFGAGNHQDVVTINAFDALGNPVPVTITPAGNDTVAGNTVTAGLTGETSADAAGSVLVEIPGPVAQIQILYSNLLTGTQGINVSDVRFDAIPAAANSADSLSGGAGADSILGGAGNDTITGGAGNDTLSGGSGDDRFDLADGFGADIITDFDIADTDGNGFFNDQLDVSALTDSLGNPVDAADVVVSDDGSGNALLTFPNGETLVLQGVTPAAISSLAALRSAGIPCFTEGTLIRTSSGEVPIERLKVGDLLVTEQGSLEPIRWIGRRSLGPRELMVQPQHKPILIPQRVMGNYAPLLVSPLHGMKFGDHFVRAKHLAEAPGPVRIAKGKRQVTYIHLLLGSHQVIYANGAAAESLYPGEYARNMYTAQAQREIAQAVPGIDRMPVETAYGPMALPFMKRKDALRLVDLRPGRARPMGDGTAAEPMIAAQ